MAAPAFSIPNQNAARLADPALREALLQYARRRLPAGEIDDLVQNTLTDALVSSNAPSDLSDFQRWVQGIARHKIADSYRRRGRLPVLCEDVDAKACDAAAAPGELVQWIESELPNTDGAHATLHWLLRESDGESLDEIARDAALPAPRVRQRVSRLRRHFHARWLALGAAGLLILLVAGLLVHGTREASSVPPIARESAAPVESTHPKAVESTHPKAVESTHPKAVEFGGPKQSAPAATLDLHEKGAPNQLAPSKASRNDVHSKATPKKKPRQKLKPAPVQKALSSKNALPSKAHDDDDLVDSKPIEQLGPAKKKE